MLIINAVAVHFYARFLKKKKELFSHPIIVSTPPKLMSTHNFVYMSEM